MSSTRKLTTWTKRPSAIRALKAKRLRESKVDGLSSHTGSVRCVCCPRPISPAGLHTLFHTPLQSDQAKNASVLS